MPLTKSLKLVVSILCIIGFVTSTQAQNNECGFKYTPEAQRYFDSIKSEIKILEEQFLEQQLNSRGSTVISAIPIKAHIVRQDDGTGGLTTIELNDAISEMNAIYVNAGLEFYLCDTINYIDSEDFFNYETDDESALFDAHSIDDIMNIYFTDSIISSGSGDGLCGYARFPGGSVTENILMANGCATNGSTLSHEVGHFFALSHTHGNSNIVGSSEELVDGSNCDSTGDFICDTPADPQLGGGNVNSACQYTGDAIDANNDFYTPEPLNLMSYSRKSCRTLFSNQQLARINAIYQSSRNNLMCPIFNADFIADETQSCINNLTVNFTDASAGATSWSWDVDGDDIVDYTTQNVIHTYNTIGEYDVALTISDGSNTISKVKSNYIQIGAQEINTATIELNLMLDDWPTETSWQFLDENGAVLYSGGSYIEADEFTTKTETFTIDPNLCYKFVISDSYGDGICCASGNGFYELRADDNTLLATGGDFGFGTTNNFFSQTALNVNNFETEDIRLFPNPSSNEITITSQSILEDYVIHNTLGQVIKESKAISNGNLKINIETLKEGLYFITLKKGNSSKVLSFIKN